MSDPFLAEIRLAGFNFAPFGWALCDGQILSISQNTALFSLIGTYYGGNGTSNFGLPNLQSRVPMGAGAGPGLTPRDLGEVSGDETVTILQTEMPAHTHTMMALPAPADRTTPIGNTFGRVQGTTGPYAPNASAPVNMAPNALPPVGGSLPHDNLMPYLVVNFIICMQGVYPARN